MAPFHSRLSSLEFLSIKLFVLSRKHAVSGPEITNHGVFVSQIYEVVPKLLLILSGLLWR